MISFHFGSIFGTSDMKKDTQEQLSSADVNQFTEYMTEIFANTRPKFNPELQQLMHSSKSMNLHMKLMGKFHQGADPLTFGRMNNILYQGPNPTMGELSKILSLPLSTTTRMVGLEVSLGFARRLPDPDDGRIVRVTMTDAGRKFHESMTEMHAQGAVKILGCLTPEERGILLTLLRKVATSLKKG
jgi:DNA-binding MarR family transcriptional regulator